MQPRWRREGNTTGDMVLAYREVDGESWLNVAKAGSQGIVLALVSLSWWVVAATNDVDQCWSIAAVDDVAWVLKQLVQRFGNVDKEVDAADEEGAQRGKKRQVPDTHMADHSQPNKLSQSTPWIII